MTTHHHRFLVGQFLKKMNMKSRLCGKPFSTRNLSEKVELELAVILIAPLEQIIRLHGGPTFFMLNFAVMFLQFPMVKWFFPSSGIFISGFIISIFINILVLNFSITKTCLMKLVITNNSSTV